MSWENRGENTNLPGGSDNFFDRKVHFTSQRFFFSYSNPANTFHSKFIWGQRKRVLNADTRNGNVSSIHQDCWSWQQSSVPWSVQSLKYSCLTMGLSKHKYLLLLLSPPHTSNFHKLRDLIIVDQSTYWPPLSWALSSPKDKQAPVWEWRDRKWFPVSRSGQIWLWWQGQSYHGSCPRHSWKPEQKEVLGQQPHVTALIP